MKVRKRPIEVEAVRFLGASDAVPTFGEPAPPWLVDAMRDNVIVLAGMFSDHLTIKTLEGDMICRVGDYIVKGIDGELYPVEASIFERSYEVVP